MNRNEQSEWKFPGQWILCTPFTESPPLHRSISLCEQLVRENMKRKVRWMIILGADIFSHLMFVSHAHHVYVRLLKCNQQCSQFKGNPSNFFGAWFFTGIHFSSKRSQCFTENLNISRRFLCSAVCWNLSSSWNWDLKGMQSLTQLLFKRLY